MAKNSVKQGALRVLERHLNVSLEIAQQQIDTFCKADAVEGWLCYTSSLWVKKTAQDWRQCEFISGSSTDKGVLLSAEFSSRENGKYTSLHVRSDAGRYSIYCFEVSFGTASDRSYSPN